MTANHGCHQSGVSCSRCHACKRTRFVEVVNLASGEQLRITRCTYCDYPQPVQVEGWRRRG